MLPGHHCPSRRLLCLLLVVLAAVLLGPCHRVEAYISGAPPETCDTMLPQHQSLSARAFSNCATLISFSLCLTPTIAGVSVVAEQFEYNCAQDYTITLSGHGSSQRGFMVEFRESSDSVSFDGSLSHVGEFGVASGFNTTTRLECQGHAVTQTVINTAGTTTFVWTAPQIGQHKMAQLWVTQVTSSQAYFLPRKVVVGVPNEVSCTCPENTYLSVEQTTPVYRVSCRACPANSRSDRGVQTFCACVEGFSRRGFEVSDNATNATFTPVDNSSPCVGCFTTSPTNLTVLSSQLPTVLISWTAPDNISGFEVLYRVTAGNTSTNVTLEEGTSLPMAALSNLSPGASYTLHVSAYTESGCLTPPVSTAVTALERCPENPPTITNAVAVPGDVALSYSPPPITDPIILPEDFLYAVYHRCGTDTGFTLAASGIRNVSYNLQGLPASTMCTARVLVYSVYCPLVYPRLAAEHSFNTTAAGAMAPPLEINPSGTDTLVIVITPEAGVPLYRCVYRTGRTQMTVERTSSTIVSEGWRIELPPGTYTVQCAGVNSDNFVGQFSATQSVTIGDATTVNPAVNQISAIVLGVSVSVGFVLVLLLIIILVFAVLVCCKQRGKSVYTTKGIDLKNLWAASSGQQGQTVENPGVADTKDVGGAAYPSHSSPDDETKQLGMSSSQPRTVVYNPFVSEEEKRRSRMFSESQPEASVPVSESGNPTSVTPLVAENDGEHKSTPMASFQNPHV